VGKLVQVGDVWKLGHVSKHKHLAPTLPSFPTLPPTTPRTRRSAPVDRQGGSPRLIPNLKLEAEKRLIAKENFSDASTQ